MEHLVIILDPSKALVLSAITCTVSWAFYSTLKGGFRSQRLLTVCVLMAANALFTSAMVLSRNRGGELDGMTRFLLILTILQPLIVAGAMTPALYLAVKYGNEETECIKEELVEMRERLVELATQICVFYTIHTTCLAPDPDTLLDC